MKKYWQGNPKYSEKDLCHSCFFHHILYLTRTTVRFRSGIQSSGRHSSGIGQTWCWNNPGLRVK
jgi:hypothetical protein